MSPRPPRQAPPTSPPPPTSRQPAPATVATVVCYTRTANPGTLGQRLLARQRARLEAACAAHGWTPVGWVEDLHQSGTTLDRPGLRHALALLADHHADALLACDRSRLAVDAKIAAELTALADRQGWQLLTVSPTRPATAALAATVVDPTPSLGRGGACR